MMIVQPFSSRLMLTERRSPSADELALEWEVPPREETDTELDAAPWPLARAEAEPAALSFTQLSRTVPSAR